jgi:hypothetical protein
MTYIGCADYEDDHESRESFWPDEEDDLVTCEACGRTPSVDLAERIGTTLPKQYLCWRCAEGVTERNEDTI